MVRVCGISNVLFSTKIEENCRPVHSIIILAVTFWYCHSIHFFLDAFNTFLVDLVVILCLPSFYRRLISFFNGWIYFSFGSYYWPLLGVDLLQSIWVGLVSFSSILVSAFNVLNMTCPLNYECFKISVILCAYLLVPFTWCCFTFEMI